MDVRMDGRMESYIWMRGGILKNMELRKENRGEDLNQKRP